VVGAHVGANAPLNGQPGSYSTSGASPSHCQPSGADAPTRHGPALAAKIATASAGVGFGVAGSMVQVTTVSTMRHRVVMVYETSVSVLTHRRYATRLTGRVIRRLFASLPYRGAGRAATPVATPASSVAINWMWSPATSA